MIGGTGTISNNNSFKKGYCEPFSIGDVICAMIDFDSKQISFSINGRTKGAAYTLPPQQLVCNFMCFMSYIGPHLCGTLGRHLCRICVVYVQFCVFSMFVCFGCHIYVDIYVGRHLCRVLIICFLG